MENELNSIFCKIKGQERDPFSLWADGNKRGVADKSKQNFVEP